MATFTVTNVHSQGDLKSVHGTFTTDTGDTSVVLNSDTHGLNYIADYKLSLDTGGLNTLAPKVDVSSGVITATYDDTLGYSGKFFVSGR